MNENKASNLAAQAMLLANQGDWDEAESLFSEAIELDPSYALAYKYRGMARWNQNETSDAYADCNKYLELRPGDAEAYRMRGRIKGKMGKHAEAIEDFSKAIEHGENDDNLSISYYLRCQMSGHRLPGSVMTSFTLKGHFSVRTSFTLTEHILYDTLFEEPRKESIHGRRDPQASHLPAYRRRRISQEHLHEPEANETLVLQMAQTVSSGRYRLVQGSGPGTPAASEPDEPEAAGSHYSHPAASGGRALCPDRGDRHQVGPEEAQGPVPFGPDHHPDPEAGRTR